MSPDMSEIWNRCDTRLCKGACCTFLTFNYDRKLDDDTKRFFELHGVEIKEVWIRKALKRMIRTYLKVPIQCTMFDKEKCQCKIYESRPRHCRTYPTKESPFIPAGLCSVLNPTIFTVPEKDDKDA